MTWVKDHYRKIIIVLILHTLYLLLFHPFLAIFGLGTTSFSMIPLIAIAWFFGLRVGISASVLIVIENIGLIMHNHPDDIVAIMAGGGSAGMLILIVVAIIVGGASDLKERLREEITAHQKSEQDLKQAHLYSQTLFKIVPSAVFTVDESRKITSVNEEVVALLGYQAHELIGQPCTMLFVDPLCRESCPLFDRAIPKPIRNIEYTFRSRSGDHMTVLKNAALIEDSQGNSLVGIESFIDINSRKILEDQLSYMSYHDPLTGLFNRAFLEREFIRLERERAYPISLIMIDLDEMKSVNDHLGHDAGDEILRQAAIILQSNTRETDKLIRFGGDEFVIILPHTNARATTAAIRRIRKFLERQMDNSAHVLQLSLGTATNSGDESLWVTLKRADKFMYQDKAAHKVYPSSYLISESDPITQTVPNYIEARNI